MSTIRPRGIVRETTATDRGRRLVVKVAPEGVYVRRERERWTSAYLVPWSAIYDCGAKLAARMVREDRAARKTARRNP